MGKAIITRADLGALALGGNWQPLYPNSSTHLCDTISQNA